MTTLSTQSRLTAESGNAKVSEPSVARSVISLRRMMTMTVLLLLLIAVVAVYGIHGAVQQVSRPHQFIAWTVCVMLVALAVAILLIGRYLTQQSLAIIEKQLRTLIRDDRVDFLKTSVPDDLRSVSGALHDYVSLVHSRVERLRLQKKELDIQMRVADAERRHTEAIIFSISDAVLVIDSFGELVLANVAAERLFGFKLREWQHRPIDLVLEDGSLVALLKDARMSSERGGRRNVEYSASRDSKVQTFNITLSTVMDNEGQAHGVVAVFHDITREREIAQIKTDFVSAVSHELRTPLSSIKAYVEMLVDDEAHDEETRRKFYGIIESETERLQRLIGNILNISRIESGVFEIHRENIQPNDVIGEVVTMMLPQADEKKIALEFDRDEASPAIWVDRDLFHRAVLNVVSNAVKYSRPNGHVCIRTQVNETRGYYELSVSDDGVGIRAEDLPRIFDKFYRGKDSASLAKGTGLGLNLVKHIVETVHNGEIRVASEAGVGTTMILRFPMEGTEAKS